MENSISAHQLVTHFTTNQSSLFHTYMLIGSDSKLLETTIMEITAAIFQSSDKTTMQKIQEKIHPDVREISAGEKKNIPIDEIRKVIEEASIKPWQAKYKIFVIYNIERTSIEAANALLKILEEPPSHALFFLTADNVQGVPDTILSRCQIFRLGSLGIRKTFDELVSKHNIPKHRAQVAAVLSDGNIASATDILENDWQARDYLIQILQKNRDPMMVAEAIIALCGSGEEGRQKTKKWISFLCSLVRDMIVLHNTAENPIILNTDFINEMGKSLTHYTHYELVCFFDFLLKSMHMVERNVSLSLVWENICLGT